MILFINACVRKNSRTKRLADAYLEGLNDSVTEVKLWEYDFDTVDEGYIDKRDELISRGDFDNPMFDLARQFAEAGRIVIAAPFWDLSFPASLKQYIEHINALGVTFTYTESGEPKGLCKADRLTFITTAGGYFFPEEFGFGYIKALAENFYGIGQVELIKATGLDIFGNDPEKILEKTMDEIRRAKSEQ